MNKVIIEPPYRPENVRIKQGVKEDESTLKNLNHIRKIVSVSFLGGGAEIEGFVEIYRDRDPKVMQTVSFDWFLSGLGRIINLEFCY